MILNLLQINIVYIYLLTHKGNNTAQTNSDVTQHNTQPVAPEVNMLICLAHAIIKSRTLQKCQAKTLR